ncbi:SMI1/KNR4 family protein [Actinoplanes sp. HUAS TT8]|uniref:SMI1/KNR4 family protein n=1 Tax=Actinoplanes sp. HUAS TT8 TaxID=3447453 RepID=UPI003F5263AF
MRSIYDFTTWAPLVELMRAGGGPAEGGYVAGYVGRGSWSVPVSEHQWEAELAATERVTGALAEAGLDQISFVLEESALHLITFGPAVEASTGANPGALILADGAVPEPWRRLPRPSDDAPVAASADPGLLESTLRSRLAAAVAGEQSLGGAAASSPPAASSPVAASEGEIASAEERLGVVLPDELKAVYRVFRGGWQDFGEDEEAAERWYDALRLELTPITEIYLAEPSTRPCEWEFAAMEAAVTGPDDAVQGLVGSAGWIVFAENGGGDRYAIDLTPGPRGHRGQVILIGHEENVGAELIADSLTDLLVHRREHEQPRSRADRAPAVAHVNRASVTSIEAAAHPDLEVLSIGVWSGEPFRLGPVMGLPRLRTLSAYPGTLADPMEIAGLTGLEYLELTPEDWRVLLDAGAVPGGLAAAGIEHGNRNPLAIMELANELLALRGRPLITSTVVAVSPS